jgi:hypothetical protein
MTLSHRHHFKPMQFAAGSWSHLSAVSQSVRYQRTLGALIGAAVASCPPEQLEMVEPVPEWSGDFQLGLDLGDVLIKEPRGTQTPSVINTLSAWAGRSTDFLARSLPLTIHLAASDVSPVAGRLPYVAREEWLAYHSAVKQTLAGLTPSLGSRGSTTARALHLLSESSSLLDVLKRTRHEEPALRVVAGALLGAQLTVGGIESRVATRLHGPGGNLGRLAELAADLEYDIGHEVGPTEVLPRLFLANIDAAKRSDPSYAVLSLCRLQQPMPHLIQRQFYLHDYDDPSCNLALQGVVSDLLTTAEELLAIGHNVLVHCHRGASRTGLFLRAWLMWRRVLSEPDATKVAEQLWAPTLTWNRSFTDHLRLALWPRRRFQLPGHDG